MRRTTVFILGIVAVVIIIAMFVTKNPENNAPVEDNAMRTAQAEWDAMDPEAQDIVCNLWNDGTLGDTTNFTEAYMTVTKQECENA